MSPVGAVSQEGEQGKEVGHVGGGCIWGGRPCHHPAAVRCERFGRLELVSHRQAVAQHVPLVEDYAQPVHLHDTS